MTIGLCGAHRTGKTTLADQFAQQNGIPFVRTSASEIYRALGKDPAADYSIEERLAIQYILLEGFIKQYEVAERTGLIWIADRTPIDLAAYTLADIQRTTCGQGEGLSEAVVKYVDTCMEVCNRFFGLMVLVQPGIQVVEAEGKAPGFPAYQEHLNYLMLGMLMDDRLHKRHFFMKRSTVGLEDRLKTLAAVATTSVERCRQVMGVEQATMH